MNVLLVAGDLQLVQSLYSELKLRGHHVTVVPDGEAACAAVRSGDYRLVMLTGPSAGDGGLEVCRRLRAMPDGQRCVILAAGGADGPVDLAKLLSSGVDDYLVDPANVEELDARLAVAEHRGYFLASDERKRFLRLAEERLGSERIITTPGIFVMAIQAGLITADEADEDKAKLLTSVCCSFSTGHSVGRQ